MGKIIINTDGGARGNPGPAASGFVVSREGKVLFKKGKYLGEATNNIAEYQAVNLALQWVAQNQTELQITALDFLLDSELVTKQLRGEYKIKNQNLLAIASQIKKLERDLEVAVSYHYIPRARNALADAVVNQTLDSQG